jgi:hypothetical protein
MDERLIAALLALVGVITAALVQSLLEFQER